MLTVVKFFRNPKVGDANWLISRTLRKITLINRSWVSANGVSPADEQLWLVKLVAESNHGQNKGAFICNPIVWVKPNEIIHLPPTMFDEIQMVDGMLVITPTEQGRYWLLPKDHKEHLAKKYNAYAIVVNHGGRYWF